MHANAIAQDGASGKWTRGINSDDSDAPVFLAVMLGELIHKCAFTRAGRASQSDGLRTASAWKKLFEEFDPTWVVIFDS